MKSVEYFVPGWASDEKEWKIYGELVHEIDESEDYGQDAARLLKLKNKYTLLSSSGCSCWDGDWGGWTDLTKAELKKLGAAWAKDPYGSSKTMGEWIKENIK